MYDASQLGQLNRLTGDFGMWTPMWLVECDLKPTPKLKLVRSTDPHAQMSALYFQSSREQPVTVGPLPVGSCEDL